MSGDGDNTNREGEVSLDNFVFPERPGEEEPCTNQLRRFLKRHYEIFDFFYFGVALAANSDRLAVAAANMILEKGRPEDKEKFGKITERPTANQVKLNGFARLQSENIIIRCTDNFLSFIAETIQAAMLSRPEMLRSEEMVRLDDILKFTNYPELVAFLVDRKINELSYSGISGLERFLKKRTGLDLFADDDQRTLSILGIEIRNVYTHTRGVVSDLTLKRLSGLRYDWKFIKGERFEAEYDEVISLANNFVAVSRRVDEIFAQKFGIGRSNYRKGSKPRSGDPSY